MDEMAQNILKNKMFENIGRVPMLYGLNYYLGEYNNNTKLDDSEADFIFSGWYFERFTYIHPYDPRYLKAGKFIIYHMMFIIMFCYIKYRNTLTIYV